MCLMVPGKVVAKRGDLLTVDYGEQQRQGRIVEGDYAVGDYVLIQGGIVAMKVPREEAKTALRTYRDAVGP